jgi:very-short-patch-repair endonuclease
MVAFEQRLEEWRAELLDLTNRNRLLNLKTSNSRVRRLQLVAPSASEILLHLCDEKPLHIIGQPDSTVVEEIEDDDPFIDEDIEVDTLIKEPSMPVHMRSGQALSHLPNERTETTLIGLRKQAMSSEQEQGVNILFAVFGLLNWKEAPGESETRKSPLLLLPIRIDLAADGTYRVVATETIPELNTTLTERLRRDFGIQIHPPIGEDPEIDLLAVFDHVRRAISQQASWSVSDEVHIGLFQFHKLRMYQDLLEHREIAESHPIIQALAFEDKSIGEFPEAIPDEQDLDFKVPPSRVFTVLDADSSQLRAIQAVNASASVIIQGPPGTGKSQTIANIIAESIANGKTVLFVSEKAAAIDVVYRRLAERNLSDFCLRLHSQKTNKADVIQELGNRLNPKTMNRGAWVNFHLSDLERTRQQLNGYVDALHQSREPLGRSVYQIYGLLSSLNHVPLMDCLPPISSGLTFDTLANTTRVLEELSLYRDLLADLHAHPWINIATESPLGLFERRKLHDLVALACQDCAEIETMTDALAARLFMLQRVQTIHEIQEILNIVRALPTTGMVQPHWFDQSQFSSLKVRAGEAERRARQAEAEAASLFSIYDEDILNIATDEAIAEYDKSWIGRIFSPALKLTRSNMKRLSKDRTPTSRVDERAALERARKFAQDREWFLSNKSDLARDFGIQFNRLGLPENVQWSTIRSAIEAIGLLNDQLQKTFSQEFFLLASDPASVRAIQVEVALIQDRVSRLQGSFVELRNWLKGEDRKINEKGLEHETLADIKNWLDPRLTRIDEIDRVILAREHVKQAEEIGLTTFVRALMAADVATEFWGDTLRRLTFEHWIDEIRRRDPRLSHFSGVEREQLISRFRDLDKSLLASGPGRIQTAARIHWPPVTSVSIGEPRTLNNEVRKQRRHMPLRRLFEKIPNLLPSLKPCLMMSPLSVAQYLPAKSYKFDLVLFDEASQVRPADAIGAIMRGKQLVVAGDSKQLPPSNFFDRMSSDDSPSEDESITDHESILDALAARGMQSMPLNWHYRSRHEDLIAFSNHHIYNDHLITFPSAAAEKTLDRGVHFHFVSNAMYDNESDRKLKTPRKINRQEAREIASLVLNHARTRPQESLGVVTFNIQQQDAIEEEIDHLRQLDRSVAPFFDESSEEPFFVKALEQVQGDERDVMIIGIGYGRNREGRFLHQFGPLNRIGGERRLNVLVTRAKHQIIVVSSIVAADIDLARVHGRGGKLLRDYLEFAELGSSVLKSPRVSNDDGEYESPFEEAVGNALDQAGYVVKRQVGESGFRIDLGIVDPRNTQRYLLGIECDGATYHSGKTARDRDRLRQEILEGLGWSIHRVWSAEWMRNPDRELSRIVERIQNELAKPVMSFVPVPIPPSHIKSDEQPAISTADASSSVFHRTAVAEARTVQEAAPYIPASLERQWGDILNASRRAVAKLVTTCVEQEGPIHREMAIRRIANAWGLQRAGNRIQEHVGSSIDFAVSLREIERRGEFLWPIGKHVVAVRARYPDGKARSIQHVPDEELIEAFRDVLSDAFSLRRDELFVQSARYLGYQRTGQDIATRLNATFENARKRGDFILDDEVIRLP